MNNQTAKKTKLVIISIIVAIVAVLFAAFAYFAVPAMSDNAYEGIYIGDIYVGKLDKASIEKKLADEYGKYELNPRFNFEGNEFEVYASQINLVADFLQSAEEAVSYGKEGTVFKKIAQMLHLKKNPVSLNVAITCDIELLQYALSENMGDSYIGAQQYKVEYGEDCLIITNGKKGRGVNSEKLIDSISGNYTKKEPNKPVDIIIEELIPDAINPEAFCASYNREPKDAECTSDGDTVRIIPEVVGVKIDTAEATRIINENINNSESYTIPAVITFPKVTAAELEAEFTDCVIATHRTDYSTSSSNRKENIRLASEKINGKILNPGEIFSFNDVVGPRTAGNGYKMAHVYVGNKTVDGLGGGICQVSSTLYNAVVFADLEIVYRTNHSMPVSYVPLGRDATVSYGTIDFKFKNNKDTPIKLEAIPDGNNLTINIYGRKKYVKDISIENVITGSIPFSVVEEKDDTMYEDERKVVEKGSYGTNVVTYKIVKENGEVISRSFLAKSSYTPISQVERVGTLKREEESGDVSSDAGESTDVASPDVSLPDTSEPSTDIPASSVPDDESGQVFEENSQISDKTLPQEQDLSVTSDQ